MFKKAVSILLSVFILFGSIACGFSFSASAEDFSGCTEYMGASIRRGVTKHLRHSASSLKFQTLFPSFMRIKAMYLRNTVLWSLTRVF